MLNDVLYTVKKMRIFEDIGKDRTKEFAFKMIKIGEKYDCNN